MAKSKKAKSDKAPSVCNLILPVKTDHLTSIAQTIVDDGKLTVGDVNGGRFTVDEVEQRWGVWDEKTESYNEGSMNDALYRDLKSVPAVPAVHQPVLLMAAKKLGMTFAFVGQAARNASQPDNWPSHLPAWKDGYTVGDAGGRAQALKDVTRHVTDDKYVVTIGSFQYIIGDDQNNAVHNIHGNKGANTYGYNARIVKKLAFRGRDNELANIVFQVNNRIVTIPHTGDRTNGCEVVYLPNMIATAGYLVRDGKNLTYAQIAKVVESGEAKGIRFKALPEPIIGTPVTRAQLGAAVKKSMSANATKDENGKTAWERFVATQKPSKGQSKEESAIQAVWYNATVQTRNNVTVLNCFGLRNSVIDMPLAEVYGDDRNDKRITCIIGQRCGDALTYSSRMALVEEAEADAAEAEAEVEAEAEAAEEPKPKAKAKKRKRKPTKKVTEPEADVPADVPAAEEISDTADDAESSEPATVEPEPEPEAEAQPEDPAAVEAAT